MAAIYDPYLGQLRDDKVTLAALAAIGVGPRYKIVGTLAEVLAVTATYGDDALVTNLGTGGTGTLVRYGSNGWKIPYDQTLTIDTTLAYAAATTSEVVVKQVMLPAGFSALMSGLRVEIGWQKSGTTAAATSCRLRIGSGGTIADTSIGTSAALTAGTRSLSASKSLAITSANALVLVGAQNPAAPDFAFAATGGVYPVTTTINDMSATATYISLTMQMAATTDQPGAYYLKVVGLS